MANGSQPDGVINNNNPASWNKEGMNLHNIQLKMKAQRKKVAKTEEATGVDI